MHDNGFIELDRFIFSFYSFYYQPQSAPETISEKMDVSLPSPVSTFSPSPHTHTGGRSNDRGKDPGSNPIIDRLTSGPPRAGGALTPDPYLLFKDVHLNPLPSHSG